MALYRSRDHEPRIVNIGTEDEPRVVRIDPSITYNSDDHQDAVLLDARLDLFREIVSVEQATAAPGAKRGR